MKKHVYFIPGMAASSKIFERIKLPKENYQIHLLDWLTPLHKKESLHSYIKRLSKLVKEPNPLFIGVSFGGVIAQELAKHFNTKEVLIISSIKHQNEVSPFFKFLRHTKLYTLYPVTLLNWAEKLAYKFANKAFKRTLNSYRFYLPLRDRLYTQWAIRTFLNWTQKSNTTPIHIHGSKDVILPHKYISNCILIDGGSHIMIIEKSHTIQGIILQETAQFL